MHLNFTAKDIGHSDLVDEATGDVKYTIRTNIDGKLKTIRKPTKESTSDSGNVTQGIFVARTNLQAIQHPADVKDLAGRTLDELLVAQGGVDGIERAVEAGESVDPAE